MRGWLEIFRILVEGFFHWILDFKNAAEGTVLVACGDDRDLTAIFEMKSAGPIEMHMGTEMTRHDKSIFAEPMETELMKVIPITQYPNEDNILDAYKAMLKIYREKSRYKQSSLKMIDRNRLETRQIVYGY